MIKFYIAVTGEYDDGNLYLTIDHDTKANGLKGHAKLGDTWINPSKIVDAGFGDQDSKFVNTIVDLVQKYNNNDIRGM